MTRSRITETRPAGDCQVLTVESPRGSSYRRKVCSDCPWRKDAVGKFPAEAFRHSASTGYDMAQNQFGCHQSGTDKPATCAGFLLRGAEHNLATRVAALEGRLPSRIDDDGAELFEDYFEMAVANGVDAADPVLAPVRRWRG